MSNTDSSVSIIVPTLNEVENIAPLVSQITASAVPFREILFVDNNSTEYQHSKSSRAVQAPTKRGPFPLYGRTFHAFGKVAAIGERALCQSVLCS